MFLAIRDHFRVLAYIIKYQESKRLIGSVLSFFHRLIWLLSYSLVLGSVVKGLYQISFFITINIGG